MISKLVLHSSCTRITLFLLSVHNMPPKRGAKKGKRAKSAKKTVVEPTIDDHPMPLDEAVQPAAVTVENANTESAGPDTLNDSPRMVEHTNDSIEERATTIASSEQEKAMDVVNVIPETVSEPMEEEVAGVEEDSRVLSKSNDEKEHEVQRQEEEANKMTMEERKAKFNELRKKMVRPFFFIMMVFVF